MSLLLLGRKGGGSRGRKQVRPNKDAPEGRGGAGFAESFVRINFSLFVADCLQVICSFFASYMQLGSQILQKFDYFRGSKINMQPTDRQNEGRTDKPLYKDAWTLRHVKKI